MAGKVGAAGAAGAGVDAADPKLANGEFDSVEILFGAAATAVPKAPTEPRLDKALASWLFDSVFVLTGAAGAAVEATGKAPID